jgi:Na+/melibiose symporter-like transporter
MNAVARKTVPLFKKIAYAAPAFALAVVGIPIYVYIPKFYTDVVGISVATMGYILLGVRLFDAITDPEIGYFSDRTKMPFGRRRPFIVVGSFFVSLIGVGAGLSILGAAGYTPNVEQTEQVKFVLRTLYALVPSACNLIAILFALTYPINSMIHQNIRKAIDDRKKGILTISPMEPMASKF